MKTKKLLLSLMAGALLCFSTVSNAQYHSSGNTGSSSSGSSGGSGDGAFDEGVNVISVGVGFGGGLSSYSYLGGWSTSASPGFMLSFEHGVTEHIGISGAITYATSTLTSGSEIDYNPNPPYQEATYTESWKFTAIGVMVRGAYHLTVNNKFDPYGGIGLGYFDFSSKYSNTDPYAGSSYYYSEPATISLGGFAFTAFIGARYYFSDHIGAWLELGYSGYAGNLANLGIAFKL